MIRPEAAHELATFLFEEYEKVGLAGQAVVDAAARLILIAVEKDETQQKIKELEK